MSDPPYEYAFDFTNGLGDWSTWLRPSVVPPADDQAESGFVRLQAPGALDPNHIDGIGALSLIAHLALGGRGSPGILDLRDAEIEIVIRGTDFDARSAKLVFWVCSTLPDGKTSDNFPVGLQISNWANTGNDLASQITDEWQTITVRLDDDPLNWTAAGNYQSIQGDWGGRYQPFDLGQALARTDATLHLVAISDTPDDRPTGFLDLASITIRTAAPAIPNGYPEPDLVLHGDEDGAVTGTLASPDGNVSGIRYAIVQGSVRNGTVVLDESTGEFEFTPTPDFFGPDTFKGSASFQYRRLDGENIEQPLQALIYITPRNDAPVAAAQDEDRQIAPDATTAYSLRSASDADGDRLTYRIVEGSVENGLVELDAATGQYAFKPTAGFRGLAGFRYVVSDGQATSEVKQVRLDVSDEAAMPTYAMAVDSLLRGDMDVFVELVIQLAEGGDANASYHYGTWLAHGVYVPQDTARAGVFLRQALTAAPDAALQLAQLYIGGDGVARDYSEARTLLGSIDEHADGIFRLAMLDYLGLGAPADALKAAQGFLAAAKLGHAEAMATIGRRYLAGDGVVASADDAYFWLKTASASGHLASNPGIVALLEHNLQQAAAPLTLERIAELDTAAGIWRAGDATPVNDAPLAGGEAESASGAAGSVISGAFLAGSDADGDRLVWRLTDTSEAYGTVSLDEKTGAFTYMSDPGFAGEARFSYVISDGQAVSEAKDLLLDVIPVTFGFADAVAVSEDASVFHEAADGVLANDLSSDRSALKVVAVAGSATNVGAIFETGHGTLQLNDDGSFSYAANHAHALTEGESVTEVIEYEIENGLGERARATLSVRVGGVGGTVLVGNGTLIGTRWGDLVNGGQESDYLVGLEGDDVLDGGGDGFDTMQGGAGDDTYIVRRTSDSIIEFADDGDDRIRTDLPSYRLGAEVERLIGTAETGQLLVGNILANIIVAGAGNDVLDGGGGEADEMRGGSGDDRYVVRSDRDLVLEADDEGVDTVETALRAYILPAAVEKLTGTAAFSQHLTGNGLNNVLRAGGADDVLAGAAGNDLLDGGGGADLADYSGAAAGGFINLGRGTASDGDGGTDQLRSIENARGSAHADTIIGTDGSNRLVGGLGRDYLIGLGGDDILEGNAVDPSALQGGAGNDLYLVRHREESVIEFAGEGIDTIETALAAYTLSAAVENLTGTAISGQRLTGNTLGNWIRAGSGDDVLAGGRGSDLIDGGEGTDVVDYTGAAAATFVNLLRGTASDGDGGTDQLRSIENVRGSGHADTIIGTDAGNRLEGALGRDYLIGLGGDDILDGGSDGPSTLQGGTGNDLFLVRHNGDSVIELAGEGIDTVETTLAAYTLPGAVENLTGTATIGQRLTGNALGNIIQGGMGKDVLTGGGGADSFVFLDSPAQGRADTVSDFRSGEDRLVLSAEIFDGISGHGLAPGSLAFGTSARQAGELFIYDSGTGTLYFDADGSGQEEQLILAQLWPGVTISASDFIFA